MRYCHDKEINQLVASMVRDGWNYSRGRHGKLRKPDGSSFVTIPNTPSDYRAILNLRRDIRRQLSAN